MKIKTSEHRELLELAAKAAGLTIEYWAQDDYPVVCDDCTKVGWNPLTFDSDALRLAVKLNLHICIDAESAGAITVEWGFDQSGKARHSIEQEAPVGGDDYAATRRTIVRAAAEIGKGMR